MTEQELVDEARNLSTWERHRFLLMIGLAIVVALSLVGVSMALYYNSGTAQLDLSRPGYQSVRDQASMSDDFTGFSDSGPVNLETLQEFRELYEQRAAEATNYDSFGGDVMSNEGLGIDQPQ